MKAQASRQTIRGIIDITRRGVGYVAAAECERDIEIAQEYLNTAFSGDTVAVALRDSKRNERARGAVTKVIKRAKETFVGTLEQEQGTWFLKADDQRVYAKFALPCARKNLIAGYKAHIRLSKWDDPRVLPEGEILALLGPRGAHETEMRAIVLSQGFDTAFQDEILKEARDIAENRGITEADILKRRDFRGITTFTIDPHDAKDFDDALSVRMLKNGDIEIGIHIADVSHYVISGGAIDTEAAERGTSIYLVDRTIPMLPEVLSNDVCSLNPKEDKLTYSAVFVLDQEVRVKERWFGETVIHSDKRFTYSEAQSVLDAGSGDYYTELSVLDTLAKQLRAARRASGAISFETDEIKFELDEHGKPLRVFKKERLDTNLLIEDFMLLANREVATHFHALRKRLGLRDAMFVYRVHDTPDPDKIEALRVFLHAIDYELETNGADVSGAEINRLFNHVDSTPEESLIKTATIRSMAKAVYSTKNIGHFGLAFQYYTHFTSPIRRYPDVMVHRIMKSYLGGAALSKQELARYEYLAIQSSEREVAAVAAERDSVKYKQVEFMKEKIGEEFHGVITGVVDWGLYVEEVSTKAEGLVKIRDLKDDYYVMEPKKYRLVGEKTKKRYSLGDSVKIKLVGANLEAKTLDWILLT